MNAAGSNGVDVQGASANRPSVRGRMTRLNTLNTARTFERPRPRLRPRGLPPALAPHLVWATTDRAEAEWFGRDLLGGHRLLLDDADQAAFNGSFHGALIRDITLGYLDYGTRVRVRVPKLVAEQLVFMPATGTAQITTGGVTVQATPVTAAVLTPGASTLIGCDADAAHIIVRIQRAALERHLSRLLGRMLERPLVFEPAFDLSLPGSSRWNFGVQMLHAELHDRDTLLHRGVGLGQLEEFLMSALLYCQRSNYSDALTIAKRSERREVRSARDFIDRNLSRQLTVDEIAAAAGVSVRTLQNRFSDDLGQTITGYVRNRRLDCARADLADANPASGLTVTDIATRWGFAHLGRFAVVYRARFGESPSETLRG